VNTVLKLILHGLASGRVRSTPEVLDVLKELKRGVQVSTPGSEDSSKPATRECDSATQADVAEERSGSTLNHGTHKPHES
jgi:hypothetical protein